MPEEENDDQDEVERDSRNQNLMLYQGVVCRVDNMPNSKWRVIDKF